MSITSTRSPLVLKARERNNPQQQTILTWSPDMTRTEILERVTRHLGEVLDLEDVKLTESSTADDFEDWDSVNHVRLLIRIEQDLGFQFNTDEVGMVETVGQLVDLIAAKQPKS